MDFKQLRTFAWPAIEDPESAQKAAGQGFLAAVVYLILSLAELLSSAAARWLDLLLVALCGTLAKRRLSRVAAVLGVVMMGQELRGSLQAGDPFRILTAGILCLLFVNAVRGTFGYHRFAQAGRLRPPVEVLPPERPAAPRSEGHAGEERVADSGANRKPP